MRQVGVVAFLLLFGCKDAAPPPGPDASSVGGPCRPAGHYQSGKEGSYQPCCPGLQEVFYLAPGEANGTPVCWAPPARIYACVAGRCGDGVCEVGEDKRCGCVADCPRAAWGLPDPGMPATTFGTKMGAFVPGPDATPIRLFGTAVAVKRQGFLQLFLVPDPGTTPPLFSRAYVSLLIRGDEWPRTPVGDEDGALGGEIAVSVRGGRSFLLKLPAYGAGSLTITVQDAVLSDDGTHYYLKARVEGSLPAVGGGPPLQLHLGVDAL